MISLEFSNINEDAFRPVLSFDLPPAVFFNPVISGVSRCLVFTCAVMITMLCLFLSYLQPPHVLVLVSMAVIALHAMVFQILCNNQLWYKYDNCGNFEFLVIKFQKAQIQLTWQVSLTDIRGDEGSFSIPIQFKVNDGVAFNREDISTLSNNNVLVTIPVNARTTVDVQM